MDIVVHIVMTGTQVGLDSGGSHCDPCDDDLGL